MDPPCRAGTPLHIAILLNLYQSRFLLVTKATYARSIGAVEPNARLTFFEPAKGEFPDPSAFDLIVFGGGNVDPRESHPWILDVHAFLTRLVTQYPSKKILGICWGHQTIARVFGGELTDAVTPEMGVTTISLTEKGMEFFPEAAALGYIKLQQRHRREVAVAATGFSQLAHGNQCLLNEAQTILTFQGHPEKDAASLKLQVQDMSGWVSLDSEGKPQAKQQYKADTENDGKMVWQWILAWVREPGYLVGTERRHGSYSI